ncbi:hypothetical protein [Terasakiella sp.]|uniref:hypothetical protein n=1 Tax=Terasakiella sp. TaxID=2034861 RepID=UPI003B001DEF
MFVGQNKIKSANRRHYQSLIKKKKPWATGILEEFGLNADALKIISFFGILFSYLPLLVYCISEELPFVEAAESFGSYVIVFVLLIMLFVSMFIVLFGFMRYARHEDEISKRVTIGNHKKIDFLKGNLFRVISLYTLGPVLVLAFFGFSMALDGYLILGMQLLFPATIGLLVFIPAFTLTLVYKYKDVSKLNNFLAVLNGTFFSAVAYFLVFWILFRLADVGGYFQDLDDRGQSAVILFVFFLTSVVFLFFTFVTTLNMKIHYGYIFTVSLVMVFGLLIQFDGAALFLGKRTMAVLKRAETFQSSSM